MNVETNNLQGSVAVQVNKNADQVSEARKKAADSAQSDQLEKKQIQPEELFKQINALTEGGVYSVRFEKDDRSTGLVVKIVNQQSGEVIRQVPAEEVLKMKASLEDLRGNIVNTEG